MPSYIELDKQGSLPASSNTGKVVFGVNSSNEAILVDNSGTTYNFGSGGTLNFSTYNNINLSEGSYTLSGTGIFEVINASANYLYFPDPRQFNGGTIIIINTDNSYDISIGTNGYEPFVNGSLTTWSTLDKTLLYTFYSISDKWKGGPNYIK